MLFLSLSILKNLSVKLSDFGVYLFERSLTTEPIALVNGDIQVVSSWVSFAGLWISRNWSVH